MPYLYACQARPITGREEKSLQAMRSDSILYFKARGLLQGLKHEGLSRETVCFASFQEPYYSFQTDFIINGMGSCAILLTCINWNAISC